MSRSGYSDDCENIAMWRGVIASATRGKRGQRFFRDLVTALDAMPEKALVAGDWRETKVGVFLASLRAAVGATFEGWKGGRLSDGQGHAGVGRRARQLERDGRRGRAL